MKRNKQAQKLFYNFLVDKGILFNFLDFVKETPYKTFKKHCTVNKPSKYINNAYIRSRRTASDTSMLYYIDQWNEICKSKKL